ncbi:ubiE/COQ5 methyltransferase family protein [Mycobacteroides abscessus MAB_030201_1075]|uniref:UbiE/COQ5 methyltransferase family protein n=2 Tax=Mycobacteroides abscessus TaxID=36809 RepID=A0A829QE66_9MYCO|nr:ubiE/COQ5 methyltransferase family protein [Mycobacteroides abscessus MAB_030201_1075]EUA60496.1 ubiE/COQ5 methyltransferase family protein [Mycobacteroides abscessus 1948]
MLDAGCGSGAQCAWLLGEGADVTGLDLSPAMVDQARQRCGSAAKLMVADLADDLPLEPRSFDGVTCSLALHYLRDWQVPLASFARILRPGVGWSSRWTIPSARHCPISAAATFSTSWSATPGTKRMSK